MLLQLLRLRLRLEIPSDESIGGGIIFIIIIIIGSSSRKISSL
jgi:hypothetical protein